MPAAFVVFHWLASDSEKLPHLDLTASVSPWLIWLTGKPRETQSDGLGISQDEPHNLSICCLALPQPVSCLGSPCLAESPYCLGLASGKMPQLHH